MFSVKYFEFWSETCFICYQLPNIFQEKERIENIKKAEWELAVERCKGGAIPKTGKFNGMQKKWSRWLIHKYNILPYAWYHTLRAYLLFMIWIILHLTLPQIHIVMLCLVLNSYCFAYKVGYWILGSVSKWFSRFSIKCNSCYISPLSVEKVSVFVHVCVARVLVRVSTVRCSAVQDNTRASECIHHLLGGHKLYICVVAIGRTVLSLKLLEYWKCLFDNLTNIR